MGFKNNMLCYFIYIHGFCIYKFVFLCSRKQPHNLFVFTFFYMNSWSRILDIDEANIYIGAITSKSMVHMCTGMMIQGGILLCICPECNNL